MSMMLLFGGDVSPAYSLNFLGGMPGGLTYTNSSTERVYWDSTGTRRSAVANEPIFETLGGVYQGMRWEMETRTNLATNSEGAAATWTVSNVSDAGTSITGFSASLAFGNNSVLRSAFKSIVTVDATRYTISIFVQMDDGLAPVVGITSTSGDFSLVVEGDVAPLDAKVQHIAGSLYRVSAGKVAVAPINNSNGIIKYTTQSARTFRVIGIQVEAAASASSYIPTAGSAVIRQPDVLTANSISPWYNQSEGTVVFEGITSVISGSNGGLFVISDGTSAERLFSYTQGLVTSSCSDGNILQAQMTTANSVTAGSVFRAALAYKVNDFATVLSAGTVVTDTSGSLPTVTQLRFGHSSPASGLPFMGYARRFSYYNTRLPNSILQGLSRV